MLIGTSFDPNVLRTEDTSGISRLVISVIADCVDNNDCHIIHHPFKFIDLAPSYQLTSIVWGSRPSSCVHEPSGTMAPSHPSDAESHLILDGEQEANPAKQNILREKINVETPNNKCTQEQDMRNGML